MFSDFPVVRHSTFFRFLICLLAAFLLQMTSLSEEASEERGSPYPADALRHLSEANRFDLARRGGRHHTLIHGVKVYATLIHTNAEAAGIDWRLLAAIIFHESRFDPSAESNRSAKGLMQLRDVVAEQYGMPDADLFDPGVNVQLGSRLLGELMQSFREEGIDSVNAVRFALASYNSGGGTLSRRREEAVAAGLDPNDWDCVAEIYSRNNTVTPAYVTAVEETVAAYRLAEGR